MRHSQHLIRAAIDDSGIASLPCACGRESALHLIDEFFEALDADPGSLVGAGWMDEHAVDSSFFHRSAPAVARILMAALPGYDTGAAREVLLEALADLCSGDTDDLVARCRAVIRPGVPMFLEEIASGRSSVNASFAFEIIDMLGEDAWVAFAREQLADFLPRALLDDGDGRVASAP
ncbi:hypothetical protein [Streptomyces sp. NPDC001930]|uniref:hypothetical protein n=1 Tax=Streptomyces sp. NPDC001930 TaxID=3364625 RepID=UPI0036C3707B